MIAGFAPRGRVHRCFRGYYRAQRTLRRLSSRFVFQLGHMRSGSSVLTHILNTNPGIMGFGESHIHYDVADDLDWLLCNVHLELRKARLQDCWLLDKILHAERFGSDFMTRDPRCRFIFLLREPVPSVRSMMRHFPDWFTGKDLERNELETTAIKYYCEQLAFLARFSESIADPARALFTTYDQFMADTPAVFSSIESLLQLETPLREEYTVLSSTGRTGVGDTSPNIRLGRMDRTIRHDDEIPLDEAGMARCREAYDTCCSTLTERVMTPRTQEPPE